MKVKSDFVTNSSSSCFVVAWPKRITKISQVKEFIPEDDKCHVIFNDSRSQKSRKIKMTKSVVNFLAKTFNTGWLPYDDYGTYYDSGEREFCSRNNISDEEFSSTPLWRRLYYEELDHKRIEKAIKYAKKFIKQNEGSYLYVYEYGDEDGEFFSKMEHGGTFNNLPHVRVSHH